MRTQSSGGYARTADKGVHDLRGGQHQTITETRRSWPRRLKTHFDQPDVIAELDTCDKHSGSVYMVDPSLPSSVSVPDDNEEEPTEESAETPVASSRRPRVSKPDSDFDSSAE